MLLAVWISNQKRRLFPPAALGPGSCSASAAPTFSRRPFLLAWPRAFHWLPGRHTARCWVLSRPHKSHRSLTTCGLTLQKGRHPNKFGILELCLIFLDVPTVVFLAKRRKPCFRWSNQGPMPQSLLMVPSSIGI